MRKCILLIGAPGSGKGMRIEEFKKYGYTPVSSGNLLRKVGYDLSQGIFIEDSIVSTIVNDAIQKTEGNIVLDGFPRNVIQAVSFEQQHIQIDKIIYLNISKQKSVQMSLNRVICSQCQCVYTKDYYKHPKIEGICDVCGGKLVTREDDTKEVVEKRFDDFQEKTLPLIDFYKERKIEIIEINAETSLPKEIVKFL